VCVCVCVARDQEAQDLKHAKLALHTIIISKLYI
jgi:hypothetical protein